MLWLYPIPLLYIHVVYYLLCIQRLRQIASRKKEPSAYDKVRTALLGKLLLILR